MFFSSESSLFISDERIIMKTCGTTRLLDALDVIREYAKQYANMDKVWREKINRRVEKIV